MARKNLLKGLMDAAPAEDTPTDAAPAPRYPRGAIGAVGQSIAELRRNSIVEIAAEMIDGAGLKDRFEPDDPADTQLRQSIETYGQQVPVLVRHNPNYEGRYQIVYGRRRVAALKALGLPVRAMIRELDDRDLIIAQGQENTARKDLSFIEKASFAAQMQAARYDRKVICDALNIDKTVVSRMLAITDTLSDQLLRAIGSAPTSGRDKWLRMANAVKDARISDTDLIAQVERDLPSDQRLERLLTALTKPPKPKPQTTKLRGAGGKELGQTKRTAAGLTLSFKNASGFDDWLYDNIDRLHRDWLESHADEGGTSSAATEGKQHNGGTTGR